MSPTEAARLARLETELGVIRTDLAAVKERVSNVEELTRAFGPMVPEVATIRAEVSYLKRQGAEHHNELDALARHVDERFDALVKAIDDRETERRRESDAERRFRTGLLATLTFTVLLGVAGLVVQIVLASA